MELTANNLFLLCLAALALAVVAVIVDRLNFPQRPFRAKMIKPPERGQTKDRTGAHVVDKTDDSA